MGSLGWVVRRAGLAHLRRAQGDRKGRNPTDREEKLLSRSTLVNGPRPRVGGFDV